MSENAAPPKAPSAWPFAIGIVVGLLVGGVFLWLVLLLIASLITDALHVTAPWAPLIPCYLIGIGLGIFGIRETMKGIGFLGGLLVGVAVGALGTSTICTWLAVATAVR